MKVLWVEDHEPVRNMLAIAADKAARSRIQVDLVLAETLLEAEQRVRLERFDLVVLDLILPDSHDGEMTIARMANMGDFRLAVVSSSETREDSVAGALRFGCNIAPEAICKSKLPFNRFIQRPADFETFLLNFMSDASEQGGTIRAA